MINIIVWLVLLVVGIIVTVLAVRDSYLGGFSTDDLFFIGGAWVLGLAAATVIGFLNFAFNAGYGGYWFYAIFLIAPVCSVIYAIGRGVIEGWGYLEAVIWSGTAGIFLRAGIFLLGKSFYSGIELTVMEINGKLESVFENIFVGKVISFLALPIVCIIGGVSVVIYIKNKKNREVIHQMKLERREEQQREAERNRAEQERIREQEKRVYDQWEKNEESEINNLLK